MITTTTKTIKTILFASLIAVMALSVTGLSFVQAIPNNANENVPEKTRKYEVEILERTTTSIDYDENGQKTEKQIHKIRFLDKQTAKDLMNDNAEYLDYLRSLGPEGKKLAKLEIASYDAVKNAPDEIEIEVLRIGQNSIYFSPTLFPTATGGNPTDPVNVVFYNDGSAGNARSIVDTYADHSWHVGAGSNLYAYIDETPHGGTAHFQINNYQLEEGDFFGFRQHLRIFEGSLDTHGQYDFWSIGGVHYEQWNGVGHTVLSWNTGESHIRSDLSGKTGVGSIGSYNTFFSGTLQGQPFDQYAALIDLT